MPYPSIPAARKDSILKKILSPNALPISLLAKEEGIARTTLYTWRRELINQGHAVAGNERMAVDKWPSSVRFAVVVETASMSETHLAEYCRSKGLYPEQVKSWREAAIASQERQNAVIKPQQVVQYRKQIKQLERELHRKDKALAEAAALLILQKKSQALWEGGEEK